MSAGRGCRCTVPGPRWTRPIRQAPIFDGVGLNVTVLSYRGSLDFGIVADREQVCDPSELIEGLRTGLAELLHVIGDRAGRSIVGRPLLGSNGSRRIRPRTWARWSAHHTSNAVVGSRTFPPVSSSKRVMRYRSVFGWTKSRSAAQSICILHSKSTAGSWRSRLSNRPAGRDTAGTGRRPHRRRSPRPGALRVTQRSSRRSVRTRRAVVSARVARWNDSPTLSSGPGGPIPTANGTS